MKTLRLSLALLLALLLFTACGASGNLPTLDDFNMYLDGKEIHNLEKDGDYDVAQDDPSYATKRGIMVGDTLEDIAKAYGDTSCNVTDNALSENDRLERWQQTLGYSLAKYLDEFPAPASGNVLYRLTYLDGKVETDIEKLDKAVQNIEDHTLVDYMLVFLIQDGKVDSIEGLIYDYAA